MKILKPHVNLENFFSQLTTGTQPALLLDYDGTLAPFHNERDLAFPYPGIPDILNRIIKARHSRVVLISGRWTRDLIPLLGLEELPEIWGTHGIERLKPDGSYDVIKLADLASELLTLVEKWAIENGLKDACELKPGALAIHWRGKPEVQKEEIRKKVMTEWTDRAQEAGLSPVEFDGGIEFRVRGWNKGNAVKSILLEMNHATVAAYLGDDLTDEDAFRAMNDRGLAVLVRTELRDTAADLWLKPPHELLDFLLRWHKTVDV